MGKMKSRKLWLTITGALGIVGAMLAGDLETSKGIMSIVGLLVGYFFANGQEHGANAKIEAARLVGSNRAEE